MLRTEAWARRRRIHHGLGAVGSRPSMASMENRSQRSGSATVTFHAGSPSQSATGRVPGSRLVAAGEDQDPAVVVADAEFAGRADHPVGDVVVRRPGGNLEAAG